IGYAVSRDAGKTWHEGLLAGLTACTQGPFSLVSDPTAGIGADGTAYIAALFVRPGAGGPGGFAVSVSHDRGQSWRAPVPVLDLFVEGFALPGDRAAAAPNVTVRLRSVRSVDQGATWSAPIEAASFAFTAAALPGDGHPVRATGAHITAAVSSDGAAYAIFQ